MATWAVLTTVGQLCVWLLLETSDLFATGIDHEAPIAPDSGWDLAPSSSRLALVLLLGSLGVVGLWRLLRRSRRVEPVALALGGTLLGGAALGALHGTQWGLDGLYSDAGFRTQAVTRFADSAALDDYAYADLAAYYPVMWPWLQGRVAAVVDVPGWTVMKPAQILVCLLIPGLAWLLWRRILPSTQAAAVAVATTLATALAHKPDEWLVLCLLVPWWLEVCRDLKRPEAPRWGPGRHGVVLGLLLLCHTYFFVPLALATALGFAFDLARRRPLRPAPMRALAIGLVGLAVAGPTWWPMLAARLQNLPSDDLQRRWSPPGFDAPAVPLPYDPRGVIEFIGIVWLLWAARRSPMAAALLLALLVSYVFMVGGQLLQPYGLALLPEKSEELSELLLIAAAVLGIYEVAAHLRGRRIHLKPVCVAFGVIVAVLSSALSLHRGIVEPAAPSQTMRYPDGTFPGGGTIPANPRWHPWGVSPGGAGPAVVEVQEAWRALTGAELGADQVLVSARADVSASVPIRLFVTWKSIYSHPNGEFEARMELLKVLSRCRSSRCAHDLLRRNDFDRVDGLLLNADGDRYFLTVTVDNFPEGWTPQRLYLDAGLFDSPRFGLSDLPGAVLIHVRP